MSAWSSRSNRSRFANESDVNVQNAQRPFIWCRALTSGLMIHASLFLEGGMPFRTPAMLACLRGWLATPVLYENNAFLLFSHSSCPPSIVSSKVSFVAYGFVVGEVRSQTFLKSKLKHLTWDARIFWLGKSRTNRFRPRQLYQSIARIKGWKRKGCACQSNPSFESTRGSCSSTSLTRKGIQKDPWDEPNQIIALKKGAESLLGLFI